VEQWIVTTAVSLGIGVVGYFLKRTMGRVDKSETDISRIKETYTRKDEHAETRADIRQIREDYTPKKSHEKDFDECRQKIEQIKQDYIMKEDFYREFNKVDRKLDHITDILMNALKGKGA
jgi:hypothetical protein